MVQTVKSGKLDALVGLTFDANGLVNSTASKVDGVITNVTGSTVQVVSYRGLTATVGSAFIAQPSVSYKITAVSDASDTVSIAAYIGKSLIANLDFTACGFNAAGVVLSAIPVAAVVSVANDLSQLTGAVFVLGFGASKAGRQSLEFSPTDSYAFNPGAQVLIGGGGADVMTGTSGAQTLIGLAGNDTLTAGSGTTILAGGVGNDVLIAGSGQGSLYGGTGADILRGGSGPATLYGGGGADRLESGTGRNVLYGGAGADRFVFAPGHTGGLTSGSADVIGDFNHAQHDRIDLSAFDALVPGGGSLTFIGTAGFHHVAGEVRYDVTAHGLTLHADVNGDGHGDVTLVLAKVVGLTAGDFVL